MCSLAFLFFFRKSCHLWDNVEKYGGSSGGTNDVTIWHIRAACWISKVACTHTRTRAGHARTRTHNTNMWYLLLFHSNNGYVNAPQCYVIRTLPVLLRSVFASTSSSSKWSLSLGFSTKMYVCARARACISHLLCVLSTSRHFERSSGCIHLPTLCHETDSAATRNKAGCSRKFGSSGMLLPSKKTAWPWCEGRHCDYATSPALPDDTASQPRRLILQEYCCENLRSRIILSSPGRDSSVGISTYYGQDGSGIESRWGRDFLHPSRPAMGLT